MTIPNLPFLPTTDDHRERVSDKTPALFDDKSITWMSYGQVREEIEKIAPLFKMNGKGVALCCIPKSIQGVLSYLALAHAGHTIILTAPDAPNIQDLIDCYHPNFIVGGPAPDYELLDSPFPDLLFAKKIETAQQPHPDLYLVLLTSGSTGSHKGVRLSYDNIASNTAAIVKSIDLTDDTIALGYLPLSYSFGLSILHIELTVGGRILLSEESMMSGQLWHWARAQEVTLFPGVPYQYEMLMRLGLSRLNVPSMKIFLQAGGKMQQALTQKVLESVQAIAGGELHIMYGQTEAAPRISSFPLHSFPDKIGSAGCVLDGGSVSIEDRELVYRGPNVMMGYANSRADLSKGDEVHGELHTGDYATIDDEGFITITGRTQHFAKLYGQRVALDDLEKIASKHAFSVAVEGKEKAILFTHEQDPECLQKIKHDLSEKTGLPAPWFEIRYIDEIPHKPNGKIDYIKIKNMVK